jgi:hypothetical protein
MVAVVEATVVVVVVVSMAVVARVVTVVDLEVKLEFDELCMATYGSIL